MLSTCSCTYWPSVCLLWRNVWSASRFLNQIVCFFLLSCMNSLYILDINPLSGIWFTNIFTHLVGGLFILLMVSFAVWKLFSLMWSCLLIFAFVAIAFGVKSKNNHCRGLSQETCSLSHVQLFVTPQTSPSVSSVHGILQAKILEWVAISSSRGSSPPRDRTCISCISCISRDILYHWATWEAQAQSFLVGVLRWYGFSTQGIRSACRPVGGSSGKVAHEQASY